MKYLLLMTVLLLSACSSTGVIPIDKGSFMIGRRSAQAGFGPPSGTKADVYQEANEFCTKEHKTVKTINLNVTNTGFGRPGNVELIFNCE